MTHVLNRDPERFAATYEWLREHDPRLPSLLGGIDDLAQLPVSTIETYVAEARTWYPESAIRYLVSEFDAADHEKVSLIPQRTDTIWRTLDDAVVRVAPTVAALMVPVFWQMGPMFFKTCRARGVPVSVLTPRNIPLAKQLIAEVKAELIVATPETARELAQALETDGLLSHIKAWHLVAPLGTDVTIPSLSGDVLLERQLIPGVPIISTTDGDTYGLYPDFLGELVDGRLLVTSLEKHARPLLRLELPARFREAPDGRIRYAK